MKDFSISCYNVKVPGSNLALYSGLNVAFNRWAYSHLFYFGFASQPLLFEQRKFKQSIMKMIDKLASQYKLVNTTLGNGKKFFSG